MKTLSFSKIIVPSPRDKSSPCLKFKKIKITIKYFISRLHNYSFFLFIYNSFIKT